MACPNSRGILSLLRLLRQAFARPECSMNSQSLRYNKIMECKQSTSVESLCKGCLGSTASHLHGLACARFGEYRVAFGEVAL